MYTTRPHNAQIPKQSVVINHSWCYDRMPSLTAVWFIAGGVRGICVPPTEPAHWGLIHLLWKPCIAVVKFSPVGKLMYTDLNFLIIALQVSCNIRHSVQWARSNKWETLQYSEGVASTVQRESLANWLFSRIWWKKFGEATRLSIVSTKLDGFSLANHGQFTKFAKLSCYTVYIVTATHLSTDTGLLMLVFVFSINGFKLQQRQCNIALLILKFSLQSQGPKWLYITSSHKVDDLTRAIG